MCRIIEAFNQGDVFYKFCYTFFYKVTIRCYIAICAVAATATAAVWKQNKHKPVFFVPVN